ncbi:hypothetical protein AB0H36_36600 [Kribbella sp. NPDC050820]|uniref:hypothetical protein n=1 Tax=Kribbella sp. NPDC050820 TaxID=3155408 RepID=UPI0033D28B27
MSKFLGFLLGVAVAFAGPAVFGVLAAPGGIELNTKEMALAYGIGALIFWTVVSYFSGAAALGAFAAFGTLVYCWLWIPNRTTNFLNDVPGVTTGMIEGSRQYTLNGVVPILTVISLVFGIQLIVQSMRRRRRERVEADRLQREQEAAQAQQEAEAAAVYPVAGSTYPAAAGYGGAYGDSNRYDDLFDEDPEPVRPRSQAEEQTTTFPTSGAEQTAQFPGFEEDARSNESADETVLVPTDRDETTQVPVEPTPTQPVAAAPVDSQTVAGGTTPDTEQTLAAPAPAAPAAAEQPGVAVPAKPDAETAAADVQAEDEQPTVAAPVKAGDDETVVAGTAADEQQTAVAEEPTQSAASQQPSDAEDEQPTVAAPVNTARESTGTGAGAGPGTDAGTGAGAGAGAGGQGAVAGADAGADDDTVVAGEQKPVAGAQEPAQQPEPDAPQKPEQESKNSAQAGPVPGVREQVGQQYRERMEDPEDTGELFISAFENPSQVSIRPAGA